MKETDKICIVTGTTPGFYQWTMVMIHSFLKTNTWFKGDIFVVHAGLTESMQEDLLLFSGVKLIEPSEKLSGKLDQLSNAIPKFKHLAARFFSFEAFRIRGYKKVLFLDSDMIFLDSIQEVFQLPDPFYASAESCWYSGLGRQISTYEKAPFHDHDDDFISFPVNSGFMLLDEAFLRSDHYDRLLDMITPEVWLSRNTFHADQLLINICFNGMISFLDARYNYRSKDGREIKIKDNVDFRDVKVLHFFRWFKPWIFNEVLRTSGDDAFVIQGYELWYQAYIDFLKFFHFKKKFSSPKKNTQ